MSFPTPQRAAKKNLSSVLAENIAQRILKGEYPAGSILPGEMELGSLFGVSRTAVREAVKTLTAKGMLLPRPRIGTRVMPRSQWNFLDRELLVWWMTKDNFGDVVNDFIVMRHSLEPQACALAAQHSDDKQQQKLIGIMKQMVTLQEQFDRARWIDIDMAYHELIYTMSGNAFMTSFANLFRPVYYNYFFAVTDNQVVKLELHQAIVDAICQRDSTAAFNACVALLNEPMPHK
ncbi:FadR/GntR family transcriptional regulator [Citrobacter sp. JGM124]|uniref:FadR/GntR family transcriptional regulator n=1 Tax=Citrobacter sp. JGM124 TaxID=2799789 RepID=UPI001BAC3F1D|nr:FadR/GntR family transcriptional regulator [Citrobacter sp. JGM124]MBS0848004.1 FadR family transcriptional regulator [Citrobacter sp. JGM124]